MDFFDENEHFTSISIICQMLCNTPNYMTESIPSNSYCDHCTEVRSALSSRHYSYCTQNVKLIHPIMTRLVTAYVLIVINLTNIMSETVLLHVETLNIVCMVEVLHECYGTCIFHQIIFLELQPTESDSKPSRHSSSSYTTVNQFY